MKLALRGCFIGLALLFTVACSSRSVDTELTRCVYPDSPRTPAPSFLCGGEVAGFPVVALRSAQANSLATRDRIQAELDEQVLVWAEQWSLEWFDKPDQIEQARIALEAQLTESARVVRSRTSPKETLWLLIGLPFNSDELKAKIQGTIVAQ